MISDREDLSLLVEVVDGGSTMSTGYSAKAAALGSLEAKNGNGRVIWKNYWGCVFEEWTDKCFERQG